MKTFNEWLKKYDEVATKWEQTGLLKLVPEQFKVDCARCLEGQRFYNEIIEDMEDIAQFKRVSIPIMRRLFAGVMDGKLKLEGSVMPCKNWHTFEKIRFPEVDSYQDGYHNLDREAEAVRDIAARLIEAVQDFIYNNGKKIRLHCVSFDQNRNLMINYD